MASETKISEIVDFNPPRPLKRNATAPFVDMAALPERQRDIGGFSEREFTGGGSRFRNGDTLFARITPCLENGKTAKVNVLPEGMTAHGSTEFIVMAAREPDFDEDYVYYLARHPDFRKFAEARMDGTSGRQRVSWQSLSEFTFTFPPPKERKKIGRILRTLDDKIAVNRRINQTLEAMAQAIFKSWFVDFDPVKAKIAAKAEGRDPLRAAMAAISGKPDAELDTLPPDQFAPLAATAALFPDEMEDSELGELPQGWAYRPLSQMVNLIGGGTPKRSEASFWNGSIPWFSVKDAPAEGDVFVIATEEHITEEGLRKSSTRLLPEGATIISARGTVGKLALVGTPMAMNQSCYGVQGAKGIGPYYNFFNLKTAIDTLKQNTHGAVFDTITQSTFDTVISVCPKQEERDAFEALVTPFLRRIRNNLKETKSLVEIRDALLPRLLSGELQVQPTELEVMA